eukprot:TRINITY_DN10913_c0_g1_i1.p1 TRINITY_DN10913_c0_g1~~TRINITY_DN10913_c0_g1_i1.p1  ORF type:complete len:577 (+),score=121.29 TRINITY_DN10913_c0_g1_i1:96-1826(+)
MSETRGEQSGAERAADTRLPPSPPPSAPDSPRCLPSKDVSDINVASAVLVVAAASIRRRRRSCRKGSGDGVCIPDSKGKRSDKRTVFPPDVELANKEKQKAEERERRMAERLAERETHRRRRRQWMRARAERTREDGARESHCEEDADGGGARSPVSDSASPTHERFLSEMVRRKRSEVRRRRGRELQQRRRDLERQHAAEVAQSRAAALEQQTEVAREEESRRRLAAIEERRKERELREKLSRKRMRGLKPLHHVMAERAAERQREEELEREAELRRIRESRRPRGNMLGELQEHARQFNDARARHRRAHDLQLRDELRLRAALNDGHGYYAGRSRAAILQEEEENKLQWVKKFDEIDTRRQRMLNYAGLVKEMYAVRRLPPLQRPASDAGPTSQQHAQPPRHHTAEPSRWERPPPSPSRLAEQDRLRREKGNDYMRACAEFAKAHPKHAPGNDDCDADAEDGPSSAPRRRTRDVHGFRYLAEAKRKAKPVDRREAVPLQSTSELVGRLRGLRAKASRLESNIVEAEVRSHSPSPQRGGQCVSPQHAAEQEAAMNQQYLDAISAKLDLLRELGPA